jgi:hypothetical protein
MTSGGNAKWPEALATVSPINEGKPEKQTTEQEKHSFFQEDPESWFVDHSET